MTWYSKYVQTHVSQLAHLPQRAMQSCIAYAKPSSKRRSWLVGSSMLLVMAPVSALAVHAQTNQSNSVIDVFTSANGPAKQTVDLNVESSLGQFGQGSQSDSGDIQSDGEESFSGGEDVSLQATVNGDGANVTLNGHKTDLNPVQDSYHKSVESGNGKTNIDISIKNGSAKVHGAGIDINTSSKIHINSGSSYDDSQDDEDSSDEYRHQRDR